MCQKHFDKYVQALASLRGMKALKLSISRLKLIGRVLSRLFGERVAACFVETDALNSYKLFQRSVASLRVTESVSCLDI